MLQSSTQVVLRGSGRRTSGGRWDCALKVGRRTFPNARGAQHSDQMKPVAVCEGGGTPPASF